MRVALMVCLVALAGCASSDKATGTDDEGTNDGGEVALLTQNVTLSADAPLTTEAFTGAFTRAHDPMLADAVGPAVQNHDLGHILSAGHNFIRASIEPADGTFGISLTPDDLAQIWTYDCGGCMSPAESFEAAVSPGDLQLSVRYYGSSLAQAADHAQEIPYTVTVEVDNAATRIPSGVALAIELDEPGDGFELAAVDGGAPQVLVFGPDDVFLGNLADGEVLQEQLASGVTGEYVLVPPGHGTFYAMTVSTAEDGTMPEVRILGQTVVTDDPQAVGGAAATNQDTWTADAPVKPLRVGVCASSSGAGAANNVKLHVASPEGIDILTSSWSGPWFPRLDFCGFTPAGASTLTAGEYTFTYSDEGSHNGAAQHFLMFYGR